jgi:hypothetical protein
MPGLTLRRGMAAVDSRRLPSADGVTVRFTIATAVHEPVHAKRRDNIPSS